MIYQANGLFCFATTLVLSLVLTGGAISLTRTLGWVDKPKENRWSKTSASLFGGVAIVLAFFLSLIVQVLLPGNELLRHPELIGLAVGGVALFAVGLRDDAKPLNPLVKLVGQIASILPFIIGVGIQHPSTTFLFLMPIMLFWMLALSNSFNLLDNMDGLCAGTSAIVALSLTAFGALTAQPLISLFSAMIGASCLGFLWYNYRVGKPALIFMGDCGSMFLGYMLSGLTILAVYPADQISLLQGVSQVLPALLLMALPLFDTTLVVIIRKKEGRAISQGGRDHSSHRLVYSGFGEKQAVALLYGVSFVGGMAALALAKSGIPALNLFAVAFEIGLLVRFGVKLSRFSSPPIIENQAQEIPALNSPMEKPLRPLVGSNAPSLDR